MTQQLKFILRQGFIRIFLFHQYIFNLFDQMLVAYIYVLSVGNLGCSSVLVPLCSSLVFIRTLSQLTALPSDDHHKTTDLILPPTKARKELNAFLNVRVTNWNT